MIWNPLRIFARKTTEPHPDIHTFITKRTAAGVSVGSETALNSDVVYACVRYIAQTVAQLPWYAYKTNRGARIELETSQYDGVNRILSGRVNAEMTAYRFRELMCAHALLYGNAFAEIERDQTGRAQAVYVLEPDRVTIRLIGGRQRAVYHDPTRGEYILSPDDTFHIQNFYGEGVFGKSVIEFAAESIGWARATELFGAAYFQNGIHPSGMIVLKNALSPEAYKLFDEALAERFSTAKGAHKPFITDGEATYTRFGINANEAQFTETLQHQVDVICRWFGVPPSKVGHLIHAGVRANVEQEAISVIQDTIMPWVVKFEQEAAIKLFRDGERAQTRMDLSALMRGDSAARATYYNIMRNMGAMNADEIRAEEDLNPIPDGSGQYYVMQGQYMLLRDIGARNEQPTPPAPIAPPEPAQTRLVMDPNEWAGVFRTLQNGDDTSRLDDMLEAVTKRMTPDVERD